HLLERARRDVEAELGLRLGQCEPEAAPGTESSGGGEDFLHLRRGVALAEGMRVPGARVATHSATPGEGAHVVGAVALEVHDDPPGATKRFEGPGGFLGAPDAEAVDLHDDVPPTQVELRSEGFGDV